MSSYKDGYWIFVYWPDGDHLHMLFKGVRKGFWPYGTTIQKAAIDSLSEYGLKDMRENDWQSYFVDTEVTKDWREAYAIAGKHFNTKYIPGQEQSQPTTQEERDE